MAAWCNPDGMPVTEGETKHVIYRICRAAKLPERSWHVLRHTLATHAAQLGVNPWTLQRWLGHKRIDETVRYVHLAEEHHRPIPERVIARGWRPDRPPIGASWLLAAREWHGNGRARGDPRAGHIGDR